MIIIKDKDGPVEIRMKNRGRSVIVEAPVVTKRHEDALNEQAFIAGLKLADEKEQAVLADPRYFFCEDHGAGVGCLYLSGGNIPLGILLMLWKMGDFLDTCEACGGQVHLIRLAGSPLSGHHFRSGCCFSCMKLQRIEGGSGTLRFYPRSFGALMKQHPNGIIRMGKKGRRFDWALGVAGADEPDEIVRPRVEPATFREVIAALKGEPWSG